MPWLVYLYQFFVLAWRCLSCALLDLRFIIWGWDVFDINLIRFTAILAVLSNCVLTVILLKERRRSLQNILLVCTNIALIIWNLSVFMFTFFSEGHYYSALLWWQIAYIGVISIPVFYTHFIMEFIDQKNKYFIYSLYALGVFFLATELLRPELVFRLRLVFNKFYWIDCVQFKSIIWYLIYIGFYWIILNFSFLLLLRNFFKSAGIRKTQIKFLILGS